jgi:Spy/CpxP family protein refolding chaperone
LADKRSWPAILIAVAAGLLIGFTASTLAYRFRLLRVPGGNMIERLDRDVHLSADQRTKVRELVGQSRKRLREIRRESQQKRRDVFTGTYSNIRAVLTPAQQAEFDRSFPPPRRPAPHLEPEE